MTSEEFLINHPDVSISIAGLALCCFNPTLKAWQIQLPQDDHHKLGIKIYQYDKSDKDEKKGKLIFEADKGSLGNGKRKITFTSTNAVWMDEGLAHHEGETFSWHDKEVNDKYDFRYIVDLENEHLTHAKVERINRNDVFQLTLDKCFLYTKTLSEYSYILFDKSGKDPVSKFLVDVGKFIGGKIFFYPLSPKANVNIEIEEFADPQELNQFDKYRYKICFDNDCPAKKEAEKEKIVSQCDDDFKVYYELVKPTNDNREFSLKRNNSPAVNGKVPPILGRIDCDPAWLSKTESLF